MDNLKGSLIVKDYSKLHADYKAAKQGLESKKDKGFLNFREIMPIASAAVTNYITIVKENLGNSIDQNAEKTKIIKELKEAELASVIVNAVVVAVVAFILITSFISKLPAMIFLTLIGLGVGSFVLGFKGVKEYMNENDVQYLEKISVLPIMFPY